MASVVDLFGAGFFAAFSGCVVYFIVRALLLGFSSDPLAWLEAQRVRKRSQLLGRADEAMKLNKVGEALALLRAAFYFEHPVRYPATVEAIHAHHMSILSRVIGISKSHARHLENLPIIEDLLASRESLLNAHIEHLAARVNLQHRRRRDRKETPAWAIAEFTRKIDEIGDKLSTNRHSLESQLARMFEELHRLPENEGVTYH